MGIKKHPDEGYDEELRRQIDEYAERTGPRDYEFKIDDIRVSLETREVEIKWVDISPRAAYKDILEIFSFDDFETILENDFHPDTDKLEEKDKPDSEEF